MLITPDIENTNVTSFATMPSPVELHQKLPLTDQAFTTVMKGRETLRNILDRKDKRLFVVVGPCSIHDPVAGLDYARRLKALQAEVADTMVLVMRVYFEKPRTTTGWKGYINDPFMDDSFQRRRRHGARAPVPAGRVRTGPADRHRGARPDLAAIPGRPDRLDRDRRAHHRIADPPRDVVGPVDAGRLQERHRRRRRASPSTPCCPRPTRTPSWASTSQGAVSIVRTSGNAYGHVVLRGGGGRPNYDSVSVAIAEQALKKARLPANLVVDCSHANSYKKPELQPLVMSDVIQQIRHGNQSLVGVMIESNIVGGNQPIPADLSQLKYGCSVTDGCIGWDDTEAMLRSAHHELLQRA